MGLTPTTPHLWQVMNSAKPSVELLDAVYILSHALSLKTAGAYTNLTVQLQPSVNNHATFTDSPSEVSTCTMCSNRPPCEDKEKKELVITSSLDRISQELLIKIPRGDLLCNGHTHSRERDCHPDRPEVWHIFSVTLVEKKATSPLLPLMTDTMTSTI